MQQPRESVSDLVGNQQGQGPLDGVWGRVECQDLDSVPQAAHPICPAQGIPDFGQSQGASCQGSPRMAGDAGRAPGSVLSAFLQPRAQSRRVSERRLEAGRDLQSTRPKQRAVEEGYSGSSAE